MQASAVLVVLKVIVVVVSVPVHCVTTEQDVVHVSVVVALAN